MSREMSPDILRLAAAAAAPSGLSEGARRRRFGPLEQVRVQASQVWRLRAGDLVNFVLVLQDTLTDTDLSVRVAPLTIDAPGEDADCLVANETANAFGVPVTIWAGLTTTVPLRAFDDILDQVPSEIAAYCTSVAEGRTPQAVPDACRAGRPITSIFEPASDMRAQLEDALAAFHDVPAVVPEQRTTIPKMTGVTLDQVMDVLGMIQPVAMRVLRGKYPLSEQQAAELAAATGAEKSALLEAVQRPPEAVVHAVEHPRARGSLTVLAQRQGITVQQARELAAHRIYALAAREAPGERSWHDRLRNWLDGELSRHADPRQE